jgi:hypothetical protein
VNLSWENSINVATIKHAQSVGVSLEHQCMGRIFHWIFNDGYGHQRSDEMKIKFKKIKLMLHIEIHLYMHWMQGLDNNFPLCPIKCKPKG